MKVANSPALAGAEFLAAGKISEIQAERWLDQARFVETHSVFYQGLLQGRELPDDLDELESIPFTDKAMLRENQARHPPFGNYLAADPGVITRIHRTSGTTGVAMNLALSQSDAVMTADIAARAQSAAGLKPGQRVVHCLNYQMWMGGYTDHAGLEAAGAAVIPYGVGNSSGLIRVIQELKVSAISCTPSYPAVLEQTIEQHYPGLRPADLNLELGLFGGEPGLDEPAFRDRLEQTWGFKARNSNYGVTDILCNFAGQTELDSDLHFMAPDVIYPELINPANGDPLPLKEGQSGELVLTHLAKQCQPLVRFRTGDMIVITGTGLASCGRTVPRFRVTGRSDDMVVVRGLNVFPAMISGVLHQLDTLSGLWRVKLNTRPPYDFLPLQVEVTSGIARSSGLAEQVEQAIKKHLGVSARVTLLEPGSIPRTEGKTRHVIRSYE